MAENNSQKLPELPPLDEVLSKIRGNSISPQRPLSSAEKLDSIASQIESLSKREREILGDILDVDENLLDGDEKIARTREVVTECPIKEEQCGDGKIKILIGGYKNKIICKYAEARSYYNYCSRIGGDCHFDGYK